MRMRSDSNGCSILVVSPFPEDCQTLGQFLPETGWAIRNEPTLLHATRCLRENPSHLVVCETDLPEATWHDLLAEVQRLPKPPFLILSSRSAGEHLWAEALNLGAYDVLSKPFVGAEVTRVLNMAWLHWKFRYDGGRSAPLNRRATA